MSSLRRSARGAGSLLVATVLVTGLASACDGGDSSSGGDAGPSPTESSSPSDPAVRPALQRTTRTGVGACVTLYPVRSPQVVWMRLRVTRPVVLTGLRRDEAARTDLAGPATPYLAPDPGPGAPDFALSSGPAPTRDLQENPVSGERFGNPTGTPGELAAVTASWRDRVPLVGRRLGRGTHYAFVVVDVQLGAKIKNLRIRYREVDRPRATGEVEVVDLASYRARCGA